MKIIDNEKFFEVQKKWFKTQFQKGESSKVWVDFKGVENAFKMSRGDFFEDVLHLRQMLNSFGLKRLNNSISVHKNRSEKNDLKSLQINVSNDLLEKFNRMCKTKNMTQSELIEHLLSI